MGASPGSRRAIAGIIDLVARRLKRREGLLLGCGALLLCACSFETRTNEYRCSPEGECPDGRICIDGWCTSSLFDSGGADGPIADAPSHDGPDAPPADDAAPDGAVDAAQSPDASPDARPDAGPACPNGDCGPLEDWLSCPDDCSSCEACSAGSCVEDCGVACSPTCPAGSCTCGFDCTNATLCESRCEAGTSCTVDCTNANSCDLRCLGGAECRLICTGAASCNISQCTGGSGMVSCADGYACNRGC